MATYPDGVEALYVLLDNLVIRDEDGDGQATPLTIDGVQVPPARTYLELPADMSERIRTNKEFMIFIARAGWSDDENATEGNERVQVDVYGPNADAVRTVSRGIEEGLVDHFFTVDGVGFIDDVLIAARWRISPDPTDAYSHSTATYTLVSRPD